jgi:hypothetical protein
MKKFTIAIIFITILLPGSAFAALLYSGSAQQLIYEDQTFLIEWYLDTQDQEINTVDLKFKYGTDILMAIDASGMNSDIDLWVKTPQFDNSRGTMELIGGIAGGVRSNKVKLFSSTFRAKTTGNARIMLDENSNVLLADGKGSNAPLIYAPLAFPVNPKDLQPSRIFSETHPDQDAWYKDNRVVVKFERKEGEEYSMSFSSNIDMIPNNEVDLWQEEHVFEGLPDGIYYFKLNYRTKDSGWLEAGVFRVQIDRMPPFDFDPVIAADPNVFNGRPFVSFATTDRTSGISHYEVKVGGLSSWQRIDSNYFVLPGLILGNIVEIKAVDAAGNEQIKAINLKDFEETRSIYQKYIWFIIIFVGMSFGAVVYFAAKKLKKKYSIPK